MTPGVRLQRLEASDISTLSAAEATAALRDLDVIKGRTAQLEAAVARRLDDLHRSGDGVPVADALMRGRRTSRHAAEKTERRSEALGHTPNLNDALGRGKVGTEHADVLAGAASRLDAQQRDRLFARDTEITELAASNPPEAFRRQLNRLVDDITATTDSTGRPARLRTRRLRSGSTTRPACTCCSRSSRPSRATGSVEHSMPKSQR